MAQRSLVAAIVNLPHTASSGVRWYRRTPRRLRRPGPAIRVGVATATVWFTTLFVLLGVLVNRLAPTVWADGYYLAALLGPAGLALLLAHRYREGSIVLASMFVVAQIVTVAALL